jgi:hypothetical protein
MKKGLSYIDWSISAGLFIIYIIIIFVLLSPAFKQDYSQEYLGSIIKEGLEEVASLEIERVPIFIKLDTTGTAQSTNYKFDLENLPRELENLNDNQITIYTNASSEIITKDLIYNKLSFNSTLEDLGITPNTGNASTKIWLFISSEEVFNDAASSGTVININNTFGVSEAIKGIYEPKFINFSSNDYETAKQILKFPEQKNFAVEIYNGTDLEKTPILYYMNEVPQEKDNVNILLWSNWLIHNNTQRTPVTILIKIW